jgi:hypothetical protein
MNYDKMPVAFMYSMKSSKLNCKHGSVNFGFGELEGKTNGCAKKATCTVPL